MKKENLQLLAQKFLNGTATEEEKNILHKWYDEWEDDEEVVVTASDESNRQVRDKIFEVIKNEIALTAGSQAKTVSIKQKWYMVAAAAVILALAGAYFLNPEKQTLPGSKIAIAKSKDVEAPKGTKAMIQLANGSSVLLDSINSGTLADQGHIKVVKQANGDIVYTGEGTEMSYNTLVNPRGSKVVNITLQDGTIAWLNSGSSLKYPTVFSGRERKVELAGEAYFEVAHNAAMPFKVNVTGKEEVEVLGTHFNINSYDDEPAVKTTLLQGSVKVYKNSLSKIITPGEQAVISANDNEIAVKQNVDVDEIIAWKNEKFIFQNLDLKSIMRQLERWYDINVIYSGEVPAEQYVGIVSRNVNISEILKMLEISGSVKFDVKGKTVVVKNSNQN